MPLFRRRPASQEEAIPAGTPHVVLLGYGARDTLQLTVQAQRLLSRYGRAYSLGAGPNLRRYLQSLKITLTELDDRLTPGRPFLDAYLDIARFLLDRVSAERPVILLTQGNPMFMNAIARFLVMRCRRLGLTIQVVDSVSVLDAIVNDAGIDVGAFGLQVFDASALVGRGLPLATAVPVMILNVAGFDFESVPLAGERPALDGLRDYLLGFYAPEQTITVIQTNLTGGFGHGRVALSDLSNVGAQIGPAAVLYIDAVAPAQARQEQ